MCVTSFDLRIAKIDKIDNVSIGNSNIIKLADLSHKNISIVGIKFDITLPAV